jgi:hypothetical protein
MIPQLERWATLNDDDEDEGHGNAIPLLAVSPDTHARAKGHKTT